MPSAVLEAASTMPVIGLKTNPINPVPKPLMAPKAPDFFPP